MHVRSPQLSPAPPGRREDAWEREARVRARMHARGQQWTDSEQRCFWEHIA